MRICFLFVLFFPSLCFVIKMVIWGERLFFNIDDGLKYTGFIFHAG